MLGKWTEQTTTISTMWEMKPRMTSQDFSFVNGTGTGHEA